MRIGSGAIGSEETRITGAETWKAPKVEEIKKDVTGDEVLETAKLGHDISSLLDTFKDAGSLQPLYTELTLRYGKSTDNEEMDALEPILDALKDKMKSLREAPKAESAPESSVEVTAEQPSENPPETAPDNNVIDRTVEFTQRTEMNNALKSVRNLAFEMYGTTSALTQGDKIRLDVNTALKEVRKTMEKIHSGGSLNSDIAETLTVLRRGIHNQRKEQLKTGSDAQDNLGAALNEVDQLIAEINPPAKEKLDSNIEVATA